MSIKIRPGVIEDLPEVMKMIKELADYEKSLDQVKITEDVLKKDGFGSHPYFWLLIAEKNGEIAGLAFYFIRYSTWKGKTLYLEDFIVKNEYRRLGIGTLIFKELQNIVRERGLAGIVWQVLAWNDLAVEFYKSLGATISNEWLDGILSNPS